MVWSTRTLIRHKKTTFSLRRYGALFSDHLAAARAFDRWKDARAGGFVPAQEFCDRIGASGLAFEHIASLREQLRGRLLEARLVETDQPAARSRSSGFRGDAAFHSDSVPRPGPHS